MGCTLHISYRISKQSFGKIRAVYIDRSTCIVQNTTYMIAHNAVKNGLYESIWDFLITTSTVTCASDALDLHIDEPK